MTLMASSQPEAGPTGNPLNDGRGVLWCSWMEAVCEDNEKKQVGYHLGKLI